jgi:hypothetical protein
LIMSDVDQLKPVFSGTVLAICHLAVGDVCSRPPLRDDSFHPKNHEARRQAIRFRHQH